jgi:ABC-type nitrate/sulfonate/bicarbonate transport system substrate-binding protein
VNWLNRRSLLVAAGWLTGSGIAACAGSTRPPAGVVALPERSLSYAPLLLAARAGLFASPRLDVALIQRASGQHVAAALVDGSVDAGAMALADLVSAVAAGAPLIAFGALTRRFTGQLVVAADAPVRERNLDALRAGRWRGLRVGLQTGTEGTEQAMRHILLSSSARGAREPPQGGLTIGAAEGQPPGHLPPRSLSAGGPMLAADALDDEPQWIGYGTGEALVAALKDGRIAAFLGRSLAAAQATNTRDSEVVQNLSDGSIAGDVTPAFCHVLVVRRDRAELREGQAAQLLAGLVASCASAAQALTGPEGGDTAVRALPDRDATHLLRALQLDHPSASATAYALDGRVPPQAAELYLELCARAGHRFALDAAQLTTNRFVRE